MPLIHLETKINADIHLVFDLARSIDLHTKSTSKTNEQAIAGRTSGLIELGETVTWRAKHFGITQTLTSKITDYERPFRFIDQMQKGAFRSLHHEHLFQKTDSGTLMIDKFEFSSPFCIIGHLFNFLILKKYMTKFLTKRNQMIKAFSESDKWKSIL